MLLDEGGEGGVDLAFGADFQDMELHSLHARRFLYVSHYLLDSRIVRAQEQGDHPSLGNQLPQHLKPLGILLDDEEADAREVTARPGQTGDQTLPDHVFAGDEDDWDRRGCVFRRVSRRVAGCDDHIDFAANKVGGQGGQPITDTLRPDVFYRQVLSLDIAGFAQSLAERGHLRCDGPAAPLPR